MTDSELAQQQKKVVDAEIKKRTTHRRLATQNLNKAQDALDHIDIAYGNEHFTDAKALVTELKKFNSFLGTHIAKIESINSVIYDNTESSVLDFTIDEAETNLSDKLTKFNFFRDQIEYWSNILNKPVTTTPVTPVVTNPAQGNSGASTDGQNQTRRCDIKLPKLELAHFSHEITKYTQFRESFNKAIHESNLPVISKFQYLLRHLDGDAEKAVSVWPTVLWGPRLTSVQICHKNEFS